MTDLRTDYTADTDSDPDHIDAHNAVNALVNALKGAPKVRKFLFAFDTPDLLTGAAVYTPTVGDILLDAWVEVDTAWDGTDPRCDFGPYGTSHGLIWGIDGSIGALWDLGTGPQVIDGLRSPLLSMSLISTLYYTSYKETVSGSNLSVSSLAGGKGFLPVKFTTANPIKVCVSQDGTNTGTDPGSTVGSAVLYLITATPV